MTDPEKGSRNIAPMMEGVFARQSWRPHALFNSESSISEMPSPSGDFLRPILNRTRWHQEFSHRVESAAPWPEMEFAPEPLELDTSDMPSIRPNRVDNITAGSRRDHSAELTSRERLDERPSRGRPLTGVPLRRPKLGLSVLHPRSASEIANPELRIRVSTRPIVRREVIQSADQPAEPGSASSSSRGESFSSSDRRAASAFLSGRPLQQIAAIGPARRHSPLPERAEITFTRPSPPDERAEGSQRTVIEELISRTVEPLDLPGLELRLLTPEERETPPNSPEPAREDIQSSLDSSREPATPHIGPAPPLDIDGVADRVYREIVRRQRLDRERKGLY